MKIEIIGPDCKKPMAHPRLEKFKREKRIDAMLELSRVWTDDDFWGNRLVKRNDTRKKENSCHDCADGEAPRRSKPWTCARVARKEVACNMADQWRPKGITMKMIKGSFEGEIKDD